MDLANILCVEIDTFRKTVGVNEGSIEKWFREQHKELKSLSRRAAEAQKEHGNSLKYKIRDDNKLIKLNKDCTDYAKEIAKTIWNSEQFNEKFQKFKSIFSFAQIHNLLFNDRSGFTNICPICNVDNNQRTQGGESGILASRLNALSIRLIDGAVMRICDRLSSHIVRKVWQKTEARLKENRRILVPLIMEQNRFSFEPSLKKIKGSAPPKDKNDPRESFYKEKKVRIKSSSKTCPYNGNVIGQQGEFDHIIPQASQHGTLNDEANLIYVSKVANAGKSNTSYSLAMLHQNYKETIFGYSDDEKIKEYIYTHLLGEGDLREKNQENKVFVFGQYQNFGSLNDDQKKSFRHALFLEKNSAVRAMVISAISNRNRAIVNGTQRYFAQCIADKLYKKASYIKKENYLEFDYFEHTSETNRDDSVYDLRKFYENELNPPLELSNNQKEQGSSQAPYSHFIDAQMGFLLACNNHRNAGAMGIRFDSNEETIRQGIDKQTGEILPFKIFEQTKISEKDVLPIPIDRNKDIDGCRPHRSFTRAEFYADHYVPLLIGKEKPGSIAIKIGFDWDNSIEWKEDNEKVLPFLKFSKNDLFSKNGNVCDIESLYLLLQKEYGQLSFYHINWNKRKIHEYFISNFSSDHFLNHNKEKWGDNVVRFFCSIRYITNRKTVDLAEINKEVDKSKNFEITVDLGNKNKSKIIHPVKKTWEQLKDDWGDESKRNHNSDKLSFLKDHKIFKVSGVFQKHKKTRKEISLPVVVREGDFLQKRISWDKKYIYQIYNDSDSRDDGNKFSNYAIDKSKNQLKEVINKPFRSRKQFKLKELKPSDFFLKNEEHERIDPCRWIEVEISDGLKKYIKKLEYKVDQVSRPKIKLTLAENPPSDFKDEIRKDSLTKPRKNNPDFTEIYTGSYLNDKIEKAILKSLKNSVQ